MRKNFGLELLDKLFEVSENHRDMFTHLHISKRQLTQSAFFLNSLKL